jgi:phosphohistidine phosphatase
MTLLFLRHALAEERINGVDHPERQLTDTGVRQSKTMGQLARRNKFDIRTIFSSPYRRTKETAHHFGNQLMMSPPIEIVEWLQIGTPTEDAIARILAIDHEGQDIVFVGHEPEFSLIISSMLRMKSTSIKIRKASLTCLTRINSSIGEFQLKWSITPDLLREK